MKDIQRKPPHWSHAIESGATSFYVPKGYVHVIAQGRGAGLSQGQWQWFGRESAPMATISSSGLRLSPGVPATSE